MSHQTNGCQDVAMVNDEICYEDNQYVSFRKTPDNGHCLLLMEPEKGQRTFSDYPDILTCILKIQEMYEQHRLALGLDNDQYTLQDLFQWLSECFHLIQVFIYDKEIARYKRNSREELSELIRKFIEKII